MSRHGAVATALAAVALVAPGCGGTSKEEYEKEIDRIGTTLDEQSTQIERDLQTSGGLPNAADDVEKGADALDEAADDLDDVDPPDDAQEAHERIVGGVRLLGDDFRQAAEAARLGDSRTVLELFGEFAARDGFRRIEAGLEQLADAGYDVDR